MKSMYERAQEDVRKKTQQAAEFGRRRQAIAKQAAKLHYAELDAAREHKQAVASLVSAEDFLGTIRKVH